MSNDDRWFVWCVIAVILVLGILAFATILDLHIRATQTHELMLKCLEKDTATNCAAAFKERK